MMDIMRYYRIKRIKFIIKILIIVFILVFPVTYLMYTLCVENYVSEIEYTYEDGEGVRGYIDYSMFSHKLKKYIKKDDFEFSNPEERLEKLKKIEAVDYEYKSNNKYVVSSGSFRYDYFDEIYEKDGVMYHIDEEFIFAPKWFSLKPKIVDWNVTIHQCSVE